MRTLLLPALLVALAACAPKATRDAAALPQYGFRQNLPLDSFGVVGIAAGEAGTLWLSDADDNRLVRIDPADGRVLESVDGFDRPMHIAAVGGAVVAAEYGADLVTDVRRGRRTNVPAPAGLDAPSGVDVRADRLAVADFYHHRVGYLVEGQDRSFGKKGTGPGEFTYPTDVQFAHDKLWVADAYAHRVQVFDLDGRHLLTFGEADGINAATGLYVGEDEVFVTDFENGRLLVYGLDGALRQIITEGLDKPTDAFLADGTLYVVNYGGRSLGAFAKTP